MDEVNPANEAGQHAGVEILDALEDMLASQALRLSERNRRFLSFVVRQTVEGYADRIKQYTIGVDVFGRDDSFDPAVDPIVRIEANRLRTALTAYYDGPGETDRIMITIPKGSYVPTFSLRQPSSAAPDRPGEVGTPAAAGATIVIQDHSRLTNPETELRPELFTDALLVALRAARFRVRMVPTREHSAAAQAIDALFAAPENAYSVDIAVRSLGETRGYSWRLIDLRTGEVLASDFREFAAMVTPCFDMIDGFAMGTTTRITAILGRQPASEL